MKSKKIKHVVCLSFPRSGGTFVRYIFQNSIRLSRYEKVHNFELTSTNTTNFSDKPDHFALLLLLRDYKECLVSQIIREKAPLTIENTNTHVNNTLYLLLLV